MIYSQNNEQQLIAEYFHGFIGSFLEVGSNNGITLSNCYQLSLDGWGGLCIEPSPKVWNELLKNHLEHPKVQCLNVAIGDENKMVVLHDSESILKSGDRALVSTIEESDYQRWNKHTRFDDVNVELIDFETMMELSEIKTFDLISIDAEGFDYKILKQIDLNKIGCKMLVVEWNGKDKTLYQLYCESFGMKLHAENGENLIFVR